MKYIINLLFAFLLLTCSKSTNLNPNCEIVINAQGPGFLKVINKLNSKVEVFLSEYALAAKLRANTCEIYGLNTGLRKAEISICTDSDCDTFSDTKIITFLIDDDETYVIELTKDFFGN